MAPGLHATMAAKFAGVVCVCASLSGCLGGFMIGLSQGALEAGEQLHCRQALAAGMAVETFRGSAVPPADGEAAIYALAGWQSGLDGTQTPGRLAIARHAVILVPEPGYDGVRIPHALIRQTWLDLSTVGRQARRLVVELHCVEGRHAFAIFSGGPATSLDAAAMAEARERIELARRAAPGG